MTYKEAKELYDTAKNDTALNALIEFFEYHNNNQNVLYYIADCYNELHRFSDGLKYVLPKNVLTKLLEERKARKKKRESDMEM